MNEIGVEAVAAQHATLPFTCNYTNDLNDRTHNNHY